jgi:hypothetical protein
MESRTFDFHASRAEKRAPAALGVSTLAQIWADFGEMVNDDQYFEKLMPEVLLIRLRFINSLLSRDPQQIDPLAKTLLETFRGKIQKVAKDLNLMDQIQ